ncbi:MAG: hypothetical protein RIQ44_455, partial [Actinomycetota bacterium]
GVGGPLGVPIDVIRKPDRDRGTAGAVRRWGGLQGDGTGASGKTQGGYTEGGGQQQRAENRACRHQIQATFVR